MNIQTIDAATAMDSVTRKEFDCIVATSDIRLNVRTQALNMQNAINQIEDRNPGMRVISCKEVRPKFLGG